MSVRIAESFDRLTREIRASFNDLANAANALHGADRITASQRAVLEYLVEKGPHTVPDIARNKNVSRQHVQQLTDALVSLELVAYRPNPAHKRSQLAAATQDGEAAYARIRRREAETIGSRAGMLDPGELDAAAATLAKLRAALRQSGLVS